MRAESWGRLETEAARRPGGGGTGRQLRSSEYAVKGGSPWLQRLRWRKTSGWSAVVDQNEN